MLPRFGWVLSTLALALSGWSLQAAPMDYYLRDGGPYDSRVPTPEAYFGFEVGNWHLRPDQIGGYLQALADAAPDRVRLERYGYSQEQRPLQQLIVASTARLGDLEAVRVAHLASCDPMRQGQVPVDGLPAVVNLGYSIHGNESSGANAAVMVAYWLVASQSEAAQAVRRDLVVLLDPMSNPDGLARFAQWANTHRGHVAVADRNHWEHREPWPGSRTNHYWFDLNRDWFSLVQPESRARVARLQRWRPNIVNDHHEMGTDKTFFFQPGAENRDNPTTPKRVFELEAKLAARLGGKLDQVGSFYYSAEGYDEFYLGKGSVYPDLNGGVGILYEQASSRGHVQETDFGDLTFAFTIRNQVIASLSTLEGAVGLRGELLAHQREFFGSAVAFAQEQGRGGWVFDPAGDPARAWELRSLLAQHQIEVRALVRDLTIDDHTYRAGEAFVVPAAQRQARLIEELFTRRTTFASTSFYDISAWSLALAVNLPHAEIGRARAEAKGKDAVMGAELRVGARPVGRVVGSRDAVVAYVVPAMGLDVPRVLGRLGRAGVVTQVTTKPFAAVPAGADATALRTFAPGSLIVAVGRQPERKAEIESAIDTIVAHDVVDVVALGQGMSPDGPDLGSPSWVTVTRGRVALIVGTGVSPYDAGEVWQTLDERWETPVVLLEIGDLGRVDLAGYDAIIMVDGRYAGISEKGVDAIKTWTGAGGNLVVFGGAVRWAAENLGTKLTMAEKPGAKATTKPAVADPLERLAFGSADDVERAKLVPGTLFAIEVDLTHPLAYGLGQTTVPMFKADQLALKPSDSPYQTPMWYAAKPLLAGYADAAAQSYLGGRAAAVVETLGRGRIIAMMDDPVFRGYWFGGMRLLGNAIYFGPAMTVPNFGAGDADESD